MKRFRRTLLLLSLLALPSCGGGGGGSGGGPPPASAPTPPSGPVITGPATVLPAAYINNPVDPISFTASGTGPFTWSVSGGPLPTGLSLSAAGVYSGTPTDPGLYVFEIRVTDSTGTDTALFEQNVSAVRQEEEPNDTPAEATAMVAGLPASGTLGSNDVDYWTFSGVVDQIVEFEVLGIRTNHVLWDQGGAIPRISIFGPDGISYLQGHDAFLVPNPGVMVGWNWGFHDMDIPRFRIPQTGTFYVRLEPDLSDTDGGPYLFRINALNLGAIQVESEENDDPASANAITPGTFRGLREDGDDDYFSFTVTAPTIVYFETFAYRNGASGVGGIEDDDYVDPRLVLLDDLGGILAINDDAWLFYDSCLHYLITTPGTYYLVVTETGAGCTGDGEYFVTFSETALGGSEAEGNDTPGTAGAIAYDDVVTGECTTSVQDLDYFEFTGTAGDMVRVMWFDGANHQGASDIVNVTITVSDGVTPITGVFNRANSTTQVGMNCLRAILPATGTYYVVVFGVTSDTPYAFQLLRFKDAQFESESNDSINTPDFFSVLNGPGRAAGVIGTPGDVDNFAFYADEGEVVILSIYAGSASQSDGFASFSDYGSTLHPTLTLVGGDNVQSLYAGSFLSGESITNGLATSEIAFVAPVSALFIVEVTDFDGTGSADHLYILERR